MKIFWWQAGLHIEPESKEERTALCLLLDSTRFTSIAADGLGQPAGVFLEQGSESVVGDPQIDPRYNSLSVK